MVFGPRTVPFVIVVITGNQDERQSGGRHFLARGDRASIHQGELAADPRRVVVVGVIVRDGHRIRVQRRQRIADRRDRRVGDDGGSAVGAQHEAGLAHPCDGEVGRLGGSDGRKHTKKKSWREPASVNVLLLRLMHAVQRLDHREYVNSARDLCAFAPGIIP